MENEKGINAISEENQVTEVKEGMDKQTIEIARVEIEDRGGFVWGIVGFLSPIIGLILHLVMRRSLPRNAKSLKTGVIISIIAIVILIVLYIMLIGLTLSGVPIYD